MRVKPSFRIISDFFLDGAKIIFGSLVVGIFLPSGRIGGIAWLTFGAGIVLTIIFLAIANAAAKRQDIL